MGHFRPIPGIPGAYWVRGTFGVVLGLIGLVGFLFLAYVWVIYPATHAKGFVERSLQIEYPNASLSLIDEQTVEGQHIKVFQVKQDTGITYAVVYEITDRSFREQDQEKDTSVTTQKFTIDNGVEVDVNTDTNKVSYQTTSK